MATRFYQVRITKVPVGTAVEYRAPAIQGTLQRTVTDASSRGDYQLWVVDADDNQHQANVALPEVKELSAKEAQALAPQYQPQRTATRFDLLARKETKVEIPAADLKAFIHKES
jgi:hypothetical protein